MENYIDDVEFAQWKLDDARMAMTLILEQLLRESFVDTMSQEKTAAIALFHRMRFFLAAFRCILDQIDTAKAQLDRAIELTYAKTN